MAKKSFQSVFETIDNQKGLVDADGQAVQKIAGTVTRIGVSQDGNFQFVLKPTGLGYMDFVIDSAQKHADQLSKIVMEAKENDYLLGVLYTETAEARWVIAATAEKGQKPVKKSALR